MIFKTYALYKVLCEHCFLTLQPLNRRRKKFFISALCLFLSIKGKINFLQLERYGENCEQTARNQFQDRANARNFIQHTQYNANSRLKTSFLPHSKKTKQPQ